MTAIQLVNNEGKSKSSIKIHDTFTEIQLFLKPTIDPKILSRGPVIKAYLGKSERDGVVVEVQCRIGRCDESEFFIKITEEQYALMETGVFSVEIHLDLADEGYAIYPSSLPFYLTVEGSFKP